MLRSGLNKAKKAKNHVDEALDKVRAKPWAEPLGKALQASSKIVGAVDGFVPGANVIGGALSFGATLLNPEPSVEDLQKQLREIKDTLQVARNCVFMGYMDLRRDDQFIPGFTELSICRFDFPCLDSLSLKIVSIKI